MSARVLALFACLAAAGCDLAWQDALFTPNPSRCAVAGGELCDGFESALLFPWKPVEHNATVAIDTSRAYRGVGSLHVHLEPLADATLQGELTETDVVPAPTAFLRLFAFFGAALPPGGARIAGYLQDSPPVEGPALGVENGRFATEAKTLVISSAEVPIGRWVCLEWQVTQAAAGELRAWVDDVLVADATLLGDTLTDPPAGRISFGYAIFHLGSPVPVDVWFDELILDTSRIGCAR